MRHGAGKETWKMGVSLEFGGIVWRLADRRRPPKVARQAGGLTFRKKKQYAAFQHQLKSMDIASPMLYISMGTVGVADLLFPLLNPALP